MNDDVERYGNGKPVDPAIAAAEAAEDAGEQTPLPHPDQLSLQAEGFLAPICQALFNGSIFTMRPWCPAEKVLLTICFVMGKLVGQSTAGDLTQALRLRKMCRTMFKNGIDASPPIQRLPQPMPQTGQASAAALMAAMKNGHK